MIRTYPLKHAINIGKQEKILRILKEYRKLAVKIARRQWRAFYEEGGVDKNLDIKGLETPLSERYKQTCQYQVVPVLESFIANRQNDFVRIVYNADLDAEEKKRLFYINKYKLWFAKTASMPVYDKKGKKKKGERAEIDGETIRLARAIFKHILKKHKKPRLRYCNLALDNKVARVSARKNTDKTRAKKFDYWIMLSTLEPRKAIFLPLSTNKYFESKEGILKKFCQINVNEDEKITVCLLKELPATPYVAEIPKIGLDLGLRNLFTSDRGDIYGRNFIDMLKKYDGYLCSLAQNRQRQKLKVKSPAYKALVSNLRSFLKNEINRVINRVVERYHPKEIVVENLDFRSPQLSRRMNRLLSNMGLKIIREKLESLKEQYSIIITYVPAPYTSQGCSICGYVDANNRKTQAVFICQHCNKKLHADVNAARNITVRSSDKELSNVYLRKSEILDILMERFIRHFPHIYNCAPVLVESNPYLKEHREFGTTGNMDFG